MNIISKTNTSTNTLAYEDGTEKDYFPGSSVARKAGKVMRYYWYGSEIEGAGKLTEICGKCYASGDTGKLDTATATAAAAPIQLFPAKTLEDATFTDWDSDYTTTITATLTAGNSSFKNQGTVPTT